MVIFSAHDRQFKNPSDHTSIHLIRIDPPAVLASAGAIIHAICCAGRDSQDRDLGNSDRQPVNGSSGLAMLAYAPYDTRVVS